MSAGNQVVTFRLPPELIEEIRLAVASANARRSGEPYTWSAWVRQVIEEKLAHLKRGRRCKKTVYADCTVETYTTVNYTPEGGIS